MTEVGAGVGPRLRGGDFGLGWGDFGLGGSDFGLIGGGSSNESGTGAGGRRRGWEAPDWGTRLEWCVYP